MYTSVKQSLMEIGRGLEKLFLGCEESICFRSITNRDGESEPQRLSHCGGLYTTLLCKHSNGGHQEECGSVMNV